MMSAKTAGLGAVLAAALGALGGCASGTKGGHDYGVTASGCPVPQSRPQDVSIPELVSTPRNFHGTNVRLTGFYCSGFEDSGLYSTPGCEHDTKLGVWLVGVSAIRDFRGQKISVTGEVNSERYGHMGLWAAQICVSEVDVLDGRPTAGEPLR